MSKNVSKDVSKLSPQERNSIEEVFKMFDKDSIGGFGVKQLYEVMDSFGMNPNHNEVQEMIDEIDTTGSGFVTFDVFLEAFLRKIKESEAEKDMREAFKVLDKEGNGFISIDELKVDLTKSEEVFTTEGEEVLTEEFDEFISEMELEVNQEIDIEEFITLLMSGHKSK